MSQEADRTKAEPIAIRLRTLARSEVGPDEFFREFYRLVHAALGAEAGSLWLHEAEAGQLAAKVVSKPESGLLAGLTEEAVSRVVYSALEQKKPVIYVAEETPQIPELKDVNMICVPVQLDAKVSVVVVLARQQSEDRLYTREAVGTLASICLYMEVYFAHYHLRLAGAGSGRLAKLAEIESDLAGAVELEKMAFTLANRVREMMVFDRTFVAVPGRTGFRIAAISGVDDVPQKGAAVQNLRDVVREVVRIGGDWHFTRDYMEKVEDELLAEKLRIYYETTDYKSVLLMRIEDDEGLLAVMGFERRAEGAYQGADFKFLQGVCKASSGALRRAKAFRGLPGISVVRQVDKIKRKALGPARVKFFLKTGLLVAAVGVLVFGKWDLSAKGKCRIVPQVTTFARTRQAGVVSEILKTEDDYVSRGETIAILDDEAARNAILETKSRMEAAQAEIDSYLEVRPAAAHMKMKELEVLRVQLERLELTLRHLEIKSPRDGILLTHKDRIDATLDQVVTRGEALFEIADTSRLYVEVEVDERDIALVKPGQTIYFALSGAPGRTFTCEVVHISPMTRAVPRKNVFVVRGEIVDAEPGGPFKLYLTGTARVSTGKRALLYVIFRSTLERFWGLFL